MQNYEVVPNIISSKDLDYLSDMFEWNYGALKCTNEDVSKVNSEDLKEVLQKGVTLFRNNMDMVLNELEGGYNE